MTLTLDIDQAAQERLRQRAQSIGVLPEVAEREVIEAAQNPPESQWGVLGFILLLALLTKGEELSPEVDQAIRTAFQPMVDHLLKHGTEEQLAVLLPKMPQRDPKAQAAIDLLQQWREEDAAMSPEEVAQADLDLEEFKRNMNANRAATGEEPLY
jgi:hypothetical protein